MLIHVGFAISVLDEDEALETIGMLREIAALEEELETPMKYVDEYRDPAQVKALIEEIGQAVTRPWTLMEICGGQTHAFLRHGLDQMLPAELNWCMVPAAPCV